MQINTRRNGWGSAEGEVKENKRKLEGHVKTIKEILSAEDMITIYDVLFTTFYLLFNLLYLFIHPFILY